MTVEATPEILSCVPRRLAEWRAAEDGRVVAERPRPTTKGLRGAWDHLRWLMSHPRIRFDELGSSVWDRIDGSVTVAEISSGMAERFPDRAEQMDERVALFVTALQVQGLIELRISARD